MKASLKILQRSNYQTKDGKQQICLRYTSYRRSTFVGFNVSVHPKHWNENKKQVKATEPRHLLYNQILKEQYHKAESIILANYLNPLPVKEFISRLKDRHYGNIDFYVFIDNELKLLKSSRAKEDLCATPILYSGLHVWDGTTWVGIGTPKDDGTLAPGVYEVTDPRDSEVYLARNFGAAGDWMLENLRYVPTAADFTHTAAAAPSPYTDKYYAYAEGDESPYVSANHPSSAWASKKKNGLLYNWAAATNGENTSTVDQGEGNGSANPTPGNIQQVGVQGICPANWHVPSDKEWNELEAVFAASTTQYTNSAATSFTWEASYNTTVNWRPNSANVFGHGKSMKSLCPPIGSSNATTGDSKTAAAGGFNLLLAGFALDGSANVYGDFAYLWTSSSYYGAYAWNRDVRNGAARVDRLALFRYYLFSVRCKKN